jgi:hypothetical protein
VAPSAGGPAQGEGEPGAGDQPGGCLRGQAGQPRGLGDRQPDGAEAGRAGLPAADGHRRVAEGNPQVGVVDVIAAVRGGAVAGSGVCGGELDVAAQGVADGGLAELGEGGQGGVAADPVPGPRLGLVPAQDIFARFERFLAVSSIARPGPIRSPSRSGSQAAARPASSARRSFQSHAYDRSRACIRGRGRERHLHAAALRHHPAQDRHDLGVHPRGARRDILYAGLRGRGIVLFCHKFENESRPPRITPVQFQ